MSASLFQIFVPILGCICNVIVQIGSFRCQRRISLLISMFLGLLAGLSIILGLEFFIFLSDSMIGIDFIGIITVNLAIYCFFSFIYFSFINMGETARRVRILTELYAVFGGLTWDELLRRYNASEIVGKRIKRLIDNRQVIVKKGKYRISNVVVLLWIAKIVVDIKRFLLGKESEFD